jgi:cell division protein FtsW
MKNRQSGQRPTGRSRRSGTRAADQKWSLELPASWAGLDGGILMAAVVLILLGVVMSYSTTAPLAIEQPLPPLFVRHLLALVLGLGLAALAASLPLVAWRRLAIPFYGVGVGLLVVNAIFGVEVNGAQRWLPIPGLGFRFQPAEVAKCGTLLAVAAVIATRDGHRELSDRRALMALLFLIPPVALLLLQPDLGNAILLSVLVGLLLVVAGTPLRRLILPTTVGVIGVVIYVFTTPYAARRVTGFLHPWEESQGAGFQLIQSFVAFGRGGFFGAGLGNGRQKLFYLPEAHTDFILAVVAEELGLIGVVAVLAAFAALLIYGSRIARRASSRFALLLAFGMTALLTIPAAINAAVVMGLLPTKGLTLPFLSYGRTSLLVCCVALGLILSVGRHNAAQPTARVAAGPARGSTWR